MKSLSLSFCLLISAAMTTRAADLPDLPHPVVSFGAAAVDGNVYVYGGQMEGAHQYHRDSQSGDLLRLDLSHPETGWTKIAEGKRVQGMAMVAYRGQLIRTGGLEALNAKGDDDDLVSTDEVVAWDIAAGKWIELPKLPIGQSSHCLAVAGDKLYSVGGWMMHGKNGGEEWHDGGWVLDLTNRDAGWKPLPKMLEGRRALAVVATDTHVWAIGGMSGEGPSLSVERFPIGGDAWESMPDLPKPSEDPMAGMEGFGCAAIVDQNAPVVTTITGTVWRWDEKQNQWNKAATFDPPRFFHELVRAGDDVMAVGGTSMTSGHDQTIRPIKLTK